MPGPNYAGLDKGYYAQTALTQFTAVKGGTLDESCTAVTAATDVVLGVTQQTVVAADVNRQAINVRMNGITKMVAGGTVARWAMVNINATGQVVAAGGAGTRTIGQALTGGVSGDIIDVFLTGTSGQVT